MIKNCIICGNKFEIKNFKDRQVCRWKTCSKECSDINKKNIKKRNRPKPKEHIIIKCPICGIEIISKRKDTKFCRKCAMKFTREKWKNENKEKEKESKQKYFVKNRDKIYRRLYDLRKRNISKLESTYLSHVLKNYYKIGYLNQSNELVQALRARITTKRELKQWRVIENDAIQRDGGKQSEAHEPSYEEGDKSQAKH
jgi:hypothetical protein